MPEAALRIDSLKKRFGNVQALDAVDLRLEQDELLVVLGPTGAGKTTLLRCIAGLETPDHGRITLEGRDAAGLSQAERDIALVFQNFSLYPNWTVRQNLAFPLKAPKRKLPPDTISQRINWAAELLRITPLLDRPACQLSGGEMQRVAIGRGIVRQPRIFLLDEPLTNLDAKLRENLRVELAALRRELATPMLFATHDQTEALSMGDRLVVLHEGRILQVGTPEQVYEHPASLTVAQQVGQPPINVLPLMRQDSNWHAPEGAAICPICEDDPAQAVAGVRPENVSIRGGAAPGTVRVVEDTGPAKICLIAWQNVEIRALLPPASSCKAGDTVFPSIAAETIHIWPKS